MKTLAEFLADVMEIPARWVQPGNTILEGNKRIPVRKVEVNPSGCLHHTHVNDSLCFDNAATIEILT